MPKLCSTAALDLLFFLWATFVENTRRPNSGLRMGSLRKTGLSLIVMYTTTYIRAVRCTTFIELWSTIDRDLMALFVLLCNHHLIILCISLILIRMNILLY